MKQKNKITWIVLFAAAALLIGITAVLAAALRGHGDSREVGSVTESECVEYTVTEKRERFAETEQAGEQVLPQTTSAKTPREETSSDEDGERKETEKRGTEKRGTEKRDTEKSSIKPQWLFYESVGNKVSKEQKKELDVLVNRWTKGKLTDHELTERMTEYLFAQDFEIQTAGIMSKTRCLFESEQDVQSYHDVLMEGKGIYDFIGVYTAGEKDEYGQLICYYWEAGVI